MQVCQKFRSCNCGGVVHCISGGLGSVLAAPSPQFTTNAGWSASGAVYLDAAETSHGAGIAHFPNTQERRALLTTSQFSGRFPEIFSSHLWA